MISTVTSTFAGSSVITYYETMHCQYKCYTLYINFQKECIDSIVKKLKWSKDLFSLQQKIMLNTITIYYINDIVVVGLLAIVISRHSAKQ